MAPVICPQCGSDDLDRDTATTQTGDLALVCRGCGHRWTRTPRVICSRCGSTDIEFGAYEGWAFDDIEEARDSPEGGSWSYIDREVFRCRQCNHRWRSSGEPRPYQG